MGDISSASTAHGGNSEMVSISAKILVATAIVVFITLALLFVVHIYAKWYWSTHAQEDPTVVSWRRRAARQGRNRTRTRGLDPRALQLVPQMESDPIGFKEGLECTICLSEVTQGEKIRLLPKCNHGFHVTCIDMWFRSHSTCPLCRNSVVFDQKPSTNDTLNSVEPQEVDVSSSSESETNDDDRSSYASPHSNEVPNFPTNVLFWGNETQVRSFGQPSEEASTSTTSPNNNSNGFNSQRDTLVIDIPRQVLCEDCLSSSQLGDNYDGESKTPVVTTLRSLRRLLSRGKRVAASPRGSSSVEMEQV